MTVILRLKAKMKFLVQEGERERDIETGIAGLKRKHEGNQKMFQWHLGPEEREDHRRTQL